MRTVCDATPYWCQSSSLSIYAMVTSRWDTRLKPPVGRAATIMRTGLKGDSSVEANPPPDHELYMDHLSQRQRGQMRLKLSAADVDKMVAQFVASHGSVTVCPPAYACKSRQYNLR